MAGAAEILSGIEVEERYRSVADRVTIDPQLDFLTAPNVSCANRSPRDILIGFGVPGWQQGTEDLPDSTHSITELREIPEDLHQIARLNMGVGIRLYNTPPAVSGAAENFRRIGAYMLEFDPGSVYGADRHISPLRRRLSYLALSLSCKMEGGISGEISALHRRQGDVDLAVYDQTPSGTIEQKKHGKTPLPGLAERLLVVRNPGILLIKIGETRLS